MRASLELSLAAARQMTSTALYSSPTVTVSVLFRLSILLLYRSSSYWGRPLRGLSRRGGGLKWELRYNLDMRPEGLGRTTSRKGPQRLRSSFFRIKELPYNYIECGDPSRVGVCRRRKNFEEILTFIQILSLTR